MAEKCQDSAWQWRPEFRSWFDQLVSRASAWLPSIDVNSPTNMSAVLQAAAERGEQWLYHPSVAAVTHSDLRGRRERDLALVGWLAAHADVEGYVTLTEPVWCWSTDGGVLLDSGQHELGRLAELVVAGNRAPEITLDPWCTVLGYAYADTWAAAAVPIEVSQAGVRRSVIVALRTFALIGGALPPVLGWLNSLTQTLIFLEAEDRLSRSSSAADLPGLVLADTMSEIALSELLVHESAHHLLYITEAAGPLITPGESRFFSSPLRSDPRPMRGILLAYHALAFICTFYADLMQSPIGKDVVDQADTANLQHLMHEAEATLLGAASSFTPHGEIFFDRTREVASRVLA